MDNNDLLIRLRYVLDIKDKDMVEIFKMGGMDVTKDEVQKILTKSKDSEEEESDGIFDAAEDEDHIRADPAMYESFLNGFITFKRGKQEPKPGQPEKPELTYEHANNLLLKKVKIALAMTGEDMLDVFKAANFTVSKGEIGAFLRKEGHKNYKECGDQIARNFLKGLALKHRG